MGLFEGNGGNNGFYMPVVPQSFNGYGGGNGGTNSEYERQQLQNYIQKMRNGN